MSAPVTMTAANIAPHAVLHTSQAGDMTVRATTAGSFDPNGSIRETMIDFGDGARLSPGARPHVLS